MTRTLRPVSDPYRPAAAAAPFPTTVTVNLHVNPDTVIEASRMRDGQIMVTFNDPAALSYGTGVRLFISEQELGMLFLHVEAARRAPLAHTECESCDLDGPA